MSKYHELCPACQAEGIETLLVCVGTSVYSTRFVCKAGKGHPAINKKKWRLEEIVPATKSPAAAPGWYREGRGEPLTIRTYDLYAQARLAMLARR